MERWGCVEIPESLRLHRLDDASPLSFSLPSDTDEGVAPLALATFLADAHNSLVLASEEYSLLVDQKKTRRAAVVLHNTTSSSGSMAAREVSSRRIAARDAVPAAVARDLFVRSFVRFQCFDAASGVVDLAASGVIYYLI